MEGDHIDLTIARADKALTALDQKAAFKAYLAAITFILQHFASSTEFVTITSGGVTGGDGSEQERKFKNKAEVLPDDAERLFGLAHLCLTEAEDIMLGNLTVDDVDGSDDEDDNPDASNRRPGSGGADARPPPGRQVASPTSSVQDFRDKRLSRPRSIRSVHEALRRSTTWQMSCPPSLSRVLGGTSSERVASQAAEASLGGSNEALTLIQEYSNDMFHSPTPLRRPLPNSQAHLEIPPSIPPSKMSSMNFASTPTLFAELNTTYTTDNSEEGPTDDDSDEPDLHDLMKQQEQQEQLEQHLHQRRCSTGSSSRRSSRQFSSLPRHSELAGEQEDDRDLRPPRRSSRNRHSVSSQISSCGQDSSAGSVTKRSQKSSSEEQIDPRSPALQVNMHRDKDHESENSDRLPSPHWKQKGPTSFFDEELKRLQEKQDELAHEQKALKDKKSNRLSAAFFGDELSKLEQQQEELHQQHQAEKEYQSMVDRHQQSHSHEQSIEATTMSMGFASVHIAAPTQTQTLGRRLLSPAVQLKVHGVQSEDRSVSPLDGSPRAGRITALATAGQVPKGGSPGMQRSASHSTAQSSPASIVVGASVQRPVLRKEGPFLNDPNSRARAPTPTPGTSTPTLEDPSTSAKGVFRLGAFSSKPGSANSNPQSRENSVQPPNDRSTVLPVSQPTPPKFQNYLASLPIETGPRPPLDTLGRRRSSHIDVTHLHAPPERHILFDSKSFDALDDQSVSGAVPLTSKRPPQQQQASTPPPMNRNSLVWNFPSVPKRDGDEGEKVKPLRSNANAPTQLSLHALQQQQSKSHHQLDDNSIKIIPLRSQMNAPTQLSLHALQQQQQQSQQSQTILMPSLPGNLAQPQYVSQGQLFQSSQPSSNEPYAFLNMDPTAKDQQQQQNRTSVYSTTSDSSSTSPFASVRIRSASATNVASNGAAVPYQPASTLSHAALPPVPSYLPTIPFSPLVQHHRQLSEQYTQARQQLAQLEAVTQGRGAQASGHLSQLRRLVDQTTDTTRRLNSLDVQIAEWGKRTILGVEPEELSKAILCLDVDMFRAISTVDLVQLATSARDFRPPPESLRRALDFSIFLQRVVQATILEQPQDVPRASAIIRWITVARLLAQQSDFHGLEAVLSALSHPWIARLTNTWKLVPKKYKSWYKELAPLLSNLTDAKKFKAQIEKCATPIVPVIGLIVQMETMQAKKLVASCKQDIHEWDKEFPSLNPSGGTGSSNVGGMGSQGALSGSAAAVNGGGAAAAAAQPWGGALHWVVTRCWMSEGHAEGLSLMWQPDRSRAGANGTGSGSEGGKKDLFDGLRQVVRMASGQGSGDKW
ncbi:hypothetical protein DFS34DRAFT_653857 [Phlyctochytrium arcticum]|nr:hypothetical protein DFS34DRAFT_653857 [Phlyctochytrium arcticum]